MFDKQSVLLIIGISAIGFYLYKSKQVREGYFGGGVAQTVRAERVMQTPSGMYSVPSNYQSMVSPRLSNVDYGSFIRYNTPSVNNLAVDPSDPLSAKIEVREGFDSQSSQQHIGDLHQVSAGGAQMLNAAGESVPQPIIYDRFIYANQRSRLYGLGDPIRGDIPIVPEPTGWMRPSVSPNIDAREGAIASIAGINNNTQQEMLALRTAASGNTLSTGAGVDYTVQQSPYSTMAGGDLQVTAFP